jgi:hypothetical protein
MTRYFQITSLPPGEAPTDIQAAWIGCVMPLFALRVSAVSRGVLTRQRLPARPGYSVRVLDALAVLERHSPVAAQWWRDHTPYLIRPGKLFLFALESGRLCAANASSAAVVEPADAPVIFVPALGHMPMDEPAALSVGGGNNIFVPGRPI